MASFRFHSLLVYGIALASVVVASLVRFAFDPFLGDHLSFSFHYLAVSVAGWAGGFWPALVTALISCLVGNYFFTAPHGGFAINGPEELFDMLLFIAVSIVIGVLSEASLRSLKRATAAEKQKDNFLAILAHELRNPLSVIRYANALQRLSGPEQGDDQTEIIERQVQHLSSLTEDLLDISRVANGKIRLDRRHVDARDIIDSALERVQPLIDSRGHHLNAEIGTEPIPLFADSVRLEQVLTNLLTNAAKYTPEGGHIVVRAESLGDTATLTVRDDGVGIPDEMLPRVFELFVQVDGTNERSGGGLGIGLALVRKLVELHDGSVYATSPGLNRGSEFVVCLPLEQSAVLEPVAARAGGLDVAAVKTC